MSSRSEPRTGTPRASEANRSRAPASGTRKIKRDKSCAPRRWLRRTGEATRRFSRLPWRATTSENPIPQMPVPMRFMPSRPGTRKST